MKRSGSHPFLEPTEKPKKRAKACSLLPIPSDVFEQVHSPRKTGKKGEEESKTPTEVQRLQIRSAFDAIDLDNSGFIDSSELGKAVMALGIKIPEDKIDQMMAEVDKNGDGSIDFDEFQEMMTARIDRQTPVDDIRSAFELFDQNGKGKITFQELRGVAEELGEAPTDEELKEMIKMASSSKKGYVTWKDFEKLMTKES